MNAGNKYLALHQLYAEAFKSQLAKLWGRALTSDEMNLLDSAPVCLSGMMLESFERGLAVCKDATGADGWYKDISLLYLARRPEVLALAEKRAKEFRLVLTDDLRANLLRLEEQLFAAMPQARNAGRPL